MKPIKNLNITSLKRVNYYDQYFSDISKMSTIHNLKGLTYQQEINYKNKYDNRLYLSYRKYTADLCDYRKNPLYNYGSILTFSLILRMPLFNPNMFYLN